MDIKAYISSGILELYVIGQLSPREMQEVAQMAAQYPEIKQEVLAIEQTLEAYALKNQVQVNPATFPSIKAEIKPEITDLGKTSSFPNWLGIALAAAAVLLLIGCIGLWQNNHRLQAEKTVIANDLIECKEAEQTLEQQVDRPMAILRQQGTRTILMQGTEVSPNALAAVYFNPITKKAYLDPFQLGTPESGKQYQLWALIGGQPTDMGVFEQPIDGVALIEVPFIADAEAFAITLEPAGGSVNPTLTALQVIGEVI